MANVEESILFDLNQEGSAVRINNNGLVMSVGDTVYGQRGDHLTNIGSNDDLQEFGISSLENGYIIKIGALGAGRTG